MKTLTLFILFQLPFLIQAQNTEHFKWLSGTWRGEGFGGTMEEVWSAPDRNGRLIGMFSHVDGDGNPTFYEFWTLDETGLKLRHFNPDMTAWEEKDKFVHFKMIETSQDKITLKSLVYEKTGEDTMKISLTMKYGEEVKVEVFEMTRGKD